MMRILLPLTPLFLLAVLSSVHAWNLDLTSSNVTIFFSQAGDCKNVSTTLNSTNCSTIISCQPREPSISISQCMLAERYGSFFAKVSSDRSCSIFVVVSGAFYISAPGNDLNCHGGDQDFCMGYQNSASLSYTGTSSPHRLIFPCLCTDDSCRLQR